MKKKIIIFLFTIHYSLFTSKAQNLVPNPGFEIDISCGNGAGGVNQGYIPPWDSPTNATPDTYITCMPFSIPANGWGFQYPHTGNGYVGAGYFNYNTFVNIEYIQVKLDTPLVANQMYCASFYVSLGDLCKVAVNNIGMYFSTTHTFVSTTNPLSFVPQINDTNIVSDTTNWTLIYGQYRAQGGEKYIIIGNFYNDTLNDTINTNVIGPSHPEAYYYIDDINIHCCSCDSTGSLHDGIAELSKQEAFSLYPNPNNGEMQLSYKLINNESGYVTITNVLGEKVNTYKLTNGSNIININEKQLMNGVYFYQVYINDSRVYSNKIIINK